MCDDYCLSIVSRGRSKYLLEVLEVLHISTQQPDLWVQTSEESVSTEFVSSTCVSWFCLVAGVSCGFWAGDSFACW